MTPSSSNAEMMKAGVLLDLPFSNGYNGEGCESSSGFTQQLQQCFQRYPVIVEESITGVTVYSEVDLRVGISSDEIGQFGFTRPRRTVAGFQCADVGCFFFLHFNNSQVEWI